MDHRIGAVERTIYKRCRRRWDLGSVNRRNLEPVEPQPIDLIDAVRDALAVYYYPGMWDWPSAVVLPLVRKAFMRSIATRPASPQRSADLDVGTELLERYIQWAPRIEDLGPIKIDHEVEAIVPDPRDADRGLRTADGWPVLYCTRVDLLAADAADEYWVVTHQVVPQWPDVETLLLDETAIAACWAWEQTYLGMDIAGTIHNELLCGQPVDPPAPPETTATGRPGRGGYPQHEPSGGGRSIPQHRRVDRREPTGADRVVQLSAGVLRRTQIRRSRQEIDAAATQLGVEALEMLDEGLVVYPSPSREHCRSCPFLAPCLTMTGGGDPALDLAARYRLRPAQRMPKARLGASPGGGGRGFVLPPSP